MSPRGSRRGGAGGGGGAGAVGRALRAPSVVFAEIGGYLPQGLAQGVDAESAVAESAVSRLAARTAGAYGRQPLPAGHAAAPPGGRRGRGGVPGPRRCPPVMPLPLRGVTAADPVAAQGAGTSPCS